ncbi:hypothetical protein QJQ45_007582 [Haematococcus lacustris]|nr:hypothetical protein QJQ45_007582 [Haematococcus lacustris]
MAQRRAVEAEAKAKAVAAEAEAQAQADAGVDEAEAQLHQLQADLQHREQQLANIQRLQQLQQQLQDLKWGELQRKEQQLAGLVAQQQAAMLQWEQQADLSRREQELTERHHQLQQQQSDLQSKEQQLTEHRMLTERQAHFQSLQHQLYRLQQQLEAQKVAEVLVQMSRCMGLYSKSHPYRRKGGHAARCACCTKSTQAGSTGWVEIHVEGEAAFYRSGCSHTAIGQVTAQMSEVISACDNLVPALIPLAHRTCAEAAAAALAVGKRLQGQEQPMPSLCSTPTQAAAQPGPAHAPCPHHLPDQPPSHPSQLQGSSQHHPALPALPHSPGLSILTRPATNPVTSPAVEQQPIIHTTQEQDEQTMPPSMPKQQQDWATARDDERTLVNETRRFFESSLLVMWLEFDDEQQHLEEQWRQNQHQQGGQLQQPPSMRVSLSTFVRLRPPWVARLTASQRQVCVCKTCCNLDNLLTALAQHKKSLQLPPAAAIAAPLAAPLAAAGVAPQPPPLPGGAAPLVAEEEVESLTAAASPFIDPIGEFEQQAHRWQAEQERQPWLAPPPFSPTLPPPFPTPPPLRPSTLSPPFSPPLSPPGLQPVLLPSPPPLPPPSPLPVPPPPSKTQPLSATAMRQWFLCPCELGQQPSLACSLRTCLHCKSRKLQLQPDADGSVMLTVRQYGKPSSAVGSRPVELLCMRVSLSDAIGMLNKQMPEYIKHHRLAHHQLQVFREHREAVKAGKDGKVVISCDWSEKLTVERSVEIMSEHWHAAQIGILVACAYFKNKEGAYYEQTVYVMTDGKEQSAAITQAAVNQVVCYLLAEHDMDMRQLYMWSDGCAGQFKGAPAMRQHWGMAQRFSVPVWWSYGATAHFKGRHDSEGGVVKQWLRGEILADRVGKCNALGFVQHCNAYHKAATAADPSKAHRARASVSHRWCLELSTQEVQLCSAPQRDAHAFASSIPGSMSMHSCFFPAAGFQVEWSQTACACAQCMTPAPRGECVRPSITKPFVAMPMFDQKRDDKHWDDECLTLLCSFAPDSVMQLCTLGKKLSVKMLNEYCKAVGLCVPANTLRADLRYMVLQHLNEQAECD